MKNRKSLLDFYSLILVLIFLVAFYSTKNSFNRGHIAAWDHPAHLIRAEHFYNSLNWKQLGIFGVYCGWYLCFPPFIFYTPGFFMIISLFKILTFGFLSIDLIMRIVLAVSFAAFPLFLFILAISFGLSKRTGILASIFSLFYSDVWGIGLGGIYGIGLYTIFFSLLPFMLFWREIHKISFSKSDKKNVLIGGMLFGFVIITNLITAAYSFLLLFFYIIFLSFRRKKNEIKRILEIFLIGILLSAFWLFPFFSSRNLWGPETAFNPYDFFQLVKELFLGKIIFHNFYLSVLLFFGLVFSAWRVFKKHDPSLLSLLLIFFLTLLIASDDISKAIFPYCSISSISEIVCRLFRALLRTRSLIFLWIIAPIIQAIGTDFILSKVMRIIRKENRELLTVLIILTILLFSFSRILDVSKTVRTTSDYIGYAKLLNAFHWLRENASSEDVVLIDIDWKNLEYPGTPSIDSLLNLDANVRTIKGNQIEASHIKLGILDDFNPKENKEYRHELCKFNIAFVFSYGKPYYNVSYLRAVYEDEKIVIYKVICDEEEIKIIDQKILTNEIYLKIYSPRNGFVEIPVQYNNHWVAYVNSHKKEVKDSKSGLIEIELEKGMNYVTLIFDISKIEFMFFFFSLSIFIFLLLSLLRDFVQKQKWHKLLKTNYIKNIFLKNKN
jgi:hypothetical protein